VRLVMVRDVQYFQSDGKYTRVVTHDGEALIRLPLKSLIEQLDPAQFTQIHRGAIVNLEAVDRIDREGSAMEIRIKGRNEKLTVSEAYTRQFRQM
jgi:DNA-binding LytR/AlgR family response regulator